MRSTLWETLRNRDDFLLKASILAAGLFALVVGPRAVDYLNGIECSDENLQTVADDSFGTDTYWGVASLVDGVASLNKGDVASEIADRNPYPIGKIPVGAIILYPESCDE